MFKKNLPIKMAIILISIGLSVFFLYPSFIYYTKSPEARMEYIQTHPKILKKIINLGLDLQGGMRLVLEVDRSRLENKNDKDLLDRAYTVIENRINALGVAEPTIQKQGRDRLIIELPGLKNEEAAKEVIGRTAQLEFNLLREPAQLERAVTVIDNALKGKLGPADTTGADTSADTTRVKAKEAQSLANKLFAGSEKGKSADTSKKAADTTKVRDTSGVPDILKGVASFRELLQGVGDQIGALPENKAKIDAVLARKDVREALDREGLGGNEFLWAHDTSMARGNVFRALYYVKAHPEMRGDALKDARASMDQSGMHGGQGKVDIELNSKGAHRFASVTGANVNKYLAIVLDSTVYSAPRIIQKIPSGTAEITGNFTMEDAHNLAVVLRAGALPAPVTIIEEQSVGPSLGQDSIHQGVNAGAVGLLLIVIFIIFYYRFAGVYATTAQFLHLFMTMAAMAAINATLTLPGIAGLVLNVGMAIDANVLVMERIREELALGKTVVSGIEAGYSRAFLTIIDANLTTLLTAFILLWLGTGPIKGFAITLVLGLVLSVYAGVFITHAMYQAFTNKAATKLSI